MSIISRRQRELLLNDVYRMINNNNHTAFANQAKIAECVSNGDLKFFIDSPKKEFVIRYGKKEIRFNCSDQNIKELNAIMFNNHSTIKGISDSTLLPSSNIALSTKGGSDMKEEMKREIDDKADKDHNHDSQYADKEHTHSQYADKTHTHSQYANKEHTHSGYQPAGNYALASHTHSQYADKTHTHSEYADKEHEHSQYADKEHAHPEYADKIHAHPEYADKEHIHTEYADKDHTHLEYAEKEHNHDLQYSSILHTHSEYADKLHTHTEYADKLHTHSGYADKSHTHWGLPKDRDGFEDAIKDIVSGPKWWRVVKNVVSGIEFVGDVVQTGWLWGLEARVNAMYGVLVANGMIDAAQTTSTLGTALLGYSEKLSDVGGFVNKIGQSFESVSGVCKKVAEPINKASEAVGKYAKIVDRYSNCQSYTEFKDLVARQLNGADITKAKLGNTKDILNMSLLGG